MMTGPRLGLIQLGESFSEAWPAIARAVGADLLKFDPDRYQPPSSEIAGIVISAAGVERSAKDLLSGILDKFGGAVVIAGVEADHRLVIDMLRSGASDYFVLPADLTLCREWMSSMVESSKERLRKQRFTHAERDRFDFSKLIGESPLLKAALTRTSRIIRKGTSTILITGETGTGKELLARAIHFNSSRAAHPFVEINCTTLPENLLEAELFGYEPGAFTDARTSKPGLFEVANSGTIFLDEIGDLGSHLQAKLLRVLEERRVRRLGSVREVDLDLRIISATHVDLAAAIRDGRFRRDLYYRLNVIPIRLPSLRERGEDVVRLAEYFISHFCAQYNVPRCQLTNDVKQAFRNHRWPGNVRELRNMIERGVLLGDGHLFLEDLFTDESTDGDAGPIPFPATMHAIERAAAAAMVIRCGGNKSEAAKALQISRKHLYSLLKSGEK